jgi:hypothetical protein
LNIKIRPLVTEYALMIKLMGGTSSAHSFNPYTYFGHSWSYFDIPKYCLLYRLSKFPIYILLLLHISFHAYESTSNDTNGFSWKDLPSWKCEIGRNKSTHSFNPYAYFGRSWSYFDIQNLWLVILYLFSGSHKNYIWL